MSTVLATDEQILREENFVVNIIMFWLKANYKLTNKRITGHSPNTILGFIPLGKAQISQPLKNIASVAISTKLSIKVLLFGLVFFLIGIFSFGSSVIFGLFMTILGIIFILMCYTAEFSIANNGGQAQGYAISILEKNKVQEFVNHINTVIAENN